VERKITGKNIFQALGYQYIGPVDGNNIKKVILAMSKAKWYSTTGPVIVHFKTHKGLGLASAESDEVGNYHTTDSNANSFGLAACEYLKELAFTNKKIHIINPAMTHGTGFDDFAKTLPTQYHDVGIAEEHAVSFATGLHLNGLTPVVIQYSTFLQRAYDQIHHDAARLQLPILFLTDRADLSPSDGPTHHGIYDIGYLKSIPHTIITTSRNRFQLKQLIDLGLNNKQNPFFVRYPKAPFTSETYQTEFKVKFGE
jgi:1-deoxy-D-xylulose-5-phosphate synthase